MHHADWLTEADSGPLAQSLLDSGLSFDFSSDALLSEAAGCFRAAAIAARVAREG